MTFQKGHKLNVGNKYALGNKHTEEWKLAASEKLKGNTRGFVIGKPSPRKGKKSTKPAWNKGITMPNMRGENHPNWKKDRSEIVGRHERLHTPAVKQWRRDVWERDNFKCRIKNEDCQGRIEAHHILNWKDYPLFRLDINNGITLCHFHHPRGRLNEEIFAQKFNQIIDHTTSHLN